MSPFKVSGGPQLSTYKFSGGPQLSPYKVSGGPQLSPYSGEKRLSNRRNSRCERSEGVEDVPRSAPEAPSFCVYMRIDDNA